MNVKQVIRQSEVVSMYTDFLVENIVDEYADRAIEDTKEYIDYMKKEKAEKLKDCKTYEEALQKLIEDGDEKLKEIAVDYYKKWVYDYVDEFCDMNDLSEEDKELIKKTNHNNFIGSKVVLPSYCKYYVEDYLYDILLK